MQPTTATEIETPAARDLTDAEIDATAGAGLLSTLARVAKAVSDLLRAANGSPQL